MRRVIGRAIIIIFAAALCTLALAADAQMSETRSAATPATEDKYALLSEDVEVMSRIVDKTLEEKFPGEYKTPSWFIGAGGCQGIYLNGYGVVFMTGVGFSVAERKEPEKEAATDDLWQQTKDELRGRSSQVSGVYISRESGNSKYDSEKVEKLKKELLELMAEYGGNIRQLGSQESVVITIRGGSPATLDALSAAELDKQGTVNLVVRNSKGFVQAPGYMTTGSPQLEYGELFKTPEGPKSYHWVLGRPAIRSTLIVKVSKKDITDYKDGKLDLDKLMEKAEIVQY